MGITRNARKMDNTSSRQELTTILPTLSTKAIIVVSARFSQQLMHSRIWKSGSSKLQTKRLVSSNTLIIVLLFLEHLLITEHGPTSSPLMRLRTSD
jgi:hypothetical protein